MSHVTDLGVGDASAHYEGVALAARVPVAVHPVSPLTTPGPVTEHVWRGTTDHLLTSWDQVRSECVGLL